MPSVAGPSASPRDDIVQLVMPSVAGPSASPRDDIVRLVIPSAAGPSASPRDDIVRLVIPSVATCFLSHPRSFVAALLRMTHPFPIAAMLRIGLSDRCVISLTGTHHP